jgi:uncharacterized protein (TIGR02996 family)
MWQGILDALRDDPDDLTTHLVAADWLDDEGDEARAEHVRGWVRLKTLPPRHPDRPELAGRLAALVKEHGRRWLGPATEKLLECVFAGATVARLRFPPGADQGEMVPLLQRHAVRELAVPAYTASRLAFEPALGLLCGLEIEQGAGPAGRIMDDLFVSPYLGRLRTLNLTNQFDLSLAQLIARAGTLNNLRALRLNRGVADDAGVVTLLRSPHLKNLTEWHITGQRVSALSLLQLFAPDRVARWRSLLIDTDWDYRMAAGLGSCEGLERLDLYVSHAQEDQIAFSLRNKPRLRGLTLRGQVSPRLVRLLAKWTGLARLEKLVLRPHPNLLAVTSLDRLASSPNRSPETEFEFQDLMSEEGDPTPEELFAGPQ